MFSLISLARSSSKSFWVFSVYSRSCLRRAAQVSAGFSPGLTKNKNAVEGTLIMIYTLHSIPDKERQENGTAIKGAINQINF